jgi:hypothetical protein
MLRSLVPAGATLTAKCSGVSIDLVLAKIQRSERGHSA